jgi:hypothetical protein
MNPKDKLIIKSFVLSLLVGIVFLFCISYIRAEQQSLGIYEPNSCITLIQTCGSCTYNNITSVKSPNSTTLLSETSMIKSGTEYTYQFCNTSSWGTYIVNGVGDLDGVATVWVYDFVIGEELAPVGINIILLIFFISLLISVVWLNHKIDYKKWYENILRKYENKNYVKIGLSSVAYNLMKNTFGIYYLFGFPIILIVADIILNYNVESMIGLVTNLVYIYAWGSILVGVMFFGQLQEFIVTILEDFKNIQWGMNEK